MPHTNPATNNADIGVVAVQTSDRDGVVHLSGPQPTFDWLMLLTQEAPDYSAGGIDMQAIEKIPLPYGLILKMGPDCSDTFNVEQHVLYPLHAGIDLPLHKGGRILNLKFIREEDVVCTFNLVKKDVRAKKQAPQTK